MCKVSEKSVVASPNAQLACVAWRPPLLLSAPNQNRHATQANAQLFSQATCNLSHTYITVVYPSHWQTGPFTVWVNDSSQNCVYHYFVQISSSYRKTAAKVWNWYQRWLWRNGTQISVCPSGRTGLPFQMFRCSRTFSAGTTQKVVFHLLSKRMSLKLFVNFKQPT